MFKKLSSGYKISVPGLVSTLVFFFLPWVLSSCGNDPLRQYSGWQLAMGTQENGQGYNGNLIVLLFLVGALLLLFFAFRSTRNASLSAMDGYGVAVISLVVIFFLFQQFLTPPQEGINREILYGLWGYLASWLVVLIGGVVNIVERQKRPSG